MALPFFFAEEITEISKEFILNEETSRHVVKVLRMQTGAQLQLTNGKGNVFTGEIIDNNKKKCMVTIVAASFQPQNTRKVIIAISLLKNTSRFEWFLEKATEIGISEIIPLECERTEKHHFRHDRMKTIITSAMLQSQQVWLPLLSDPMPFKDVVKRPFARQKKYIAHCIEHDSKQRIDTAKQYNDQLILIGPEGDFTKDEINEALQNNFLPVSLGENRLRTETAGVVACVLLNKC